MPFSGIRLRHFKSFKDTDDVPLRPLTVIFGRNNTGKSSLIQSLLILRQTLDSPSEGARLNLRGPLQPSGSFHDIVHQHRASDHVSMRFDFVVEGIGKASCEFEFASDEPQPPRLTRLTVSGSGFAPLEIRRGRGQGGPYEMWIGERRAGSGSGAGFFFSTYGLVPHVVPFREGGRSGKKEEVSRHLSRRVLHELTSSLLGIRAVGAFRSQPSRRYEYEGRASAMQGSIGQRVVDAIFDDASRRKGRGELVKVLNRWLRAVGRVKLLPIRRLSKSARIFELRLRDTDSGRWANFADVGFGIGQALPVLVEGLQTPIGGTFIVQEPEIHLHPDAQLAMADFLISLVESGRRVIVETHSEAILLRVRRAVLSKKKTHRRRYSRLEPSDVGVLYIDKEKGGSSRVKSLTMDQLGELRGWPKGFLGEVTDERLALLEQMAEKIEKGARGAN